MGDGAFAIEATFKSSGIPAEVMMSDDETLELGRKHTLGKECYPFIITTGDILKTLKHNDPEKCAFLMPLTHGPCRFGQYNKMQKILIEELGYHNVPIIAPGAPESSQFYKEYDMQGAKGARLLMKALTGAFTVDYLSKFARNIRPFEINKGDTDRIYDTFLKSLCDLIENTQNSNMVNELTELIDSAHLEFEKIPTEYTPKPVIGIVGEIYVRNHPFSNNEVARKIEDLGGVVRIPDFAEWPYHTNATSKLDISVKQKNIYYKILKSLRFYDRSYNGNGTNGFKDDVNITDLANLIPDLARGVRFFIANRYFNRVLKKTHHQLERPIRNSGLIDLHDADIYEVWDNAVCSQVFIPNIRCERYLPQKTRITNPVCTPYGLQ